MGKQEPGRNIGGTYENIGVVESTAFAELSFEKEEVVKSLIEGVVIENKGGAFLYKKVKAQNGVKFVARSKEQEAGSIYLSFSEYDGESGAIEDIKINSGFEKKGIAKILKSLTYTYFQAMGVSYTYGNIAMFQIVGSPELGRDIELDAYSSSSFPAFFSAVNAVSLIGREKGELSFFPLDLMSFRFNPEENCLLVSLERNLTQVVDRPSFSSKEEVEALVIKSVSQIPGIVSGDPGWDKNEIVYL